MIHHLVCYHKESKNKNFGVCPMGKNHNILYVASALCKNKHIKNTNVVLSILDEIYQCENTFERLILGALFGKKAAQFFFGWQGDEETKQESMETLMYFANYSNVGKRLYTFYSSATFFKKVAVPFVDLPLDCCSKSSPLRIALRIGIPEIVLLLLQLGANTNPCDKNTMVIEDLMSDICKENGKNMKRLQCFTIMIRAVYTVPLRKTFQWYTLFDMQKSFFNRFPCIQDLNLLPDSRCGKTPPELKHLGRCVIRNHLSKNLKLPWGIKQLGLSQKLQNYLNLLDD